MNTIHTMRSVQFGMNRVQRAITGVAAGAAALASVGLLGGTAAATEGDLFTSVATASPAPTDDNPTPQNVRTKAENLLETITKIQKDCHLRKGDPEIDSDDDALKFRCHDAIQEGQALQKMMERIPEYANQAEKLKEPLKQAQEKLDEARDTDTELIFKGLVAMIPLILAGCALYRAGKIAGQREYGSSP